MSYKVIYHGSERIITHPIFHFEQSNPYNDYGYGFYCTSNSDMAKEWANRKSSSGYINKYNFDDRALKILDLTKRDEYSVLNWISILMHHRDLSIDFRIDYEEELKYLEQFYIDISSYDVVIGYRADDAYFRFPSMFIRGLITFEKLEEIYRLGNLGKQYVLISEKAFSRIHYVESSVVDTTYHDRYVLRMERALNAYYELERSERHASGNRIRDLMRKSHD